jgi:hypothetical protein
VKARATKLQSTKSTDKNLTNTKETRKTNTMTNIQNDTIEAAIALAKARNAGTAAATRKPRPTQEELDAAREARKNERAIRQEELAAQREERKAEREIKKAQKQAAQEIKVPNTARLKTASDKLPQLSDNASGCVLNVIGANLNETELACVITHLQYSLRSRQTLAAVNGSSLEVGDEVIIVTGQANYIGKTGTVTKVSRIRCFVQVPGKESALYLYTSDVRKISETNELEETEEVTETQSTGTEG